MGCAALLCGRYADVQEFCFQTAKRTDMDCKGLQVGLLANCQEWRIVAAKRQIRGVPSCKGVDLLLFRNRVFSVRIFEIWAVLSSNEVDFLILRNRVFRL